MSEIIWYGREPEEILKEAHAALDHLGEVMARSAPSVAPDFAMRTAIAARDGLDRHRPVAGAEDSQWCSVCSQVERQPEPAGWWVAWPCPDVLGYLSILGISATEGVE